MAVDLNVYILQAMPYIKMVIYLVVGLLSVVGVGYYFFVIKRRHTWKAFLWEKKADGRLHFIGIDTITEKKFNKGKQLMYVMRRNKVEVYPPPWECCYRWHGKEYTDYIRIREDEFQPIKKELPKMSFEERSSLFSRFMIAPSLVKKMSKQEVKDKFIYAPLHKSLVMPINYEMMDYDINMMRINAIDNRDKLYADKLSFMEKYGTFMAIGIIVVLIIVVLYLSYDYSSAVINQGYAKLGETGGWLNNLATKMGGTPPPS